MAVGVERKKKKKEIMKDNILTVTGIWQGGAKKERRTAV